MATTYWDYIRTEELLALQGGVEGDEGALTNHEVVFITVHQVFELWFKLILRELSALRDVLKQDRVPEQEIASAARGLDRIRRVFGVANQHWTIMESLTTRDYLDFRDKLFPASGFQSAQMREIEILFGLAEEERIGLGESGLWRRALRASDGGDSPALAHVEARLRDGPTLREAVDQWLFRTPIRGSRPADPGDAAAVDAFAREYVDALRARGAKEADAAGAWLLDEDPRRRRIRAAILFIESYRELPLLSWPREVLERIVEVEQAMLIFRQRHARMVERIIGRRAGTGGSTGVDYLDETAIRYRVFKDLWAARTWLLSRRDLPPLEGPSFYEFAAEGSH